MMNRRNAIRGLSLAGGASLVGSGNTLEAALLPQSPGDAQARRGSAPVKIRDIKTILTAPNRIRLVVVKVETTEPGLHGWGCATFTQRALVVETAIEKYLKPFLIGRNVDDRPRATSFAIFLIGLSPLPDGAVVVPLAVVHYGMRRLAVPLFLGKFFHNVLFALIFYAFASWSAEHVSQKASTELAVLVAVLFMVLVGYHAEKARSAVRDADGTRRASQPEPGRNRQCDRGSNCS
jgi:hypothetical protein